MKTYNPIITALLVLLTLQFGKTQEAGRTHNTAIELCDFGALTIATIPYSQYQINASCFQLEEYDGNGIWFTWTASEDIPLEFVITPRNSHDDIDFVLYENAQNLESIRCMTSGAHLGHALIRGKNCLGQTGLRISANDKREAIGCENRSDNFLKPIDQINGKTYYLLVLNFQSDAGFHLSFAPEDEQIGNLNQVYRYLKDDIVSVRKSENGEMTIEYTSFAEPNATIGCGANKISSQESMSIAIAPNPVANDCNISLFSTKSKNSDISIVREDGTLTQIIPIDLNAGWNDVKIDVSQYSSGVYEIKLAGYPSQRIIKL